MDSPSPTTPQETGHGVTRAGVTPNPVSTLSLSASERETYQRIIRNGETALSRWSKSNPMRGFVERQVADARTALGIR